MVLTLILFSRQLFNAKETVIVSTTLFSKLIVFTRIDVLRRIEILLEHFSLLTYAVGTHATKVSISLSLIMVLIFATRSRSLNRRLPLFPLSNFYLWLHRNCKERSDGKKYETQRRNKYDNVSSVSVLLTLLLLNFYRRLCYLVSNKRTTGNEKIRGAYSGVKPQIPLQQSVRTKSPIKLTQRCN